MDMFKNIFSPVNLLNTYTGYKLQRNIYNEYRRASHLNQTNITKHIILPDNYGKGLPERVVEIFLLLLTYESSSIILDIGYANSMSCHLKVIRAQKGLKNVIGIDITKPTFNCRPYYNHTVVGDITKAPFTNESFKRIWCISALEHFGMDNSGYSQKYNKIENMDFLALKEMLRLLAKDGILLITVPYGKYEDNIWFRNYDKKRWQHLLDIARSKGKVYEHYFKHSHNGWSIAQPHELDNTGYYDQHNSGAAAIAAAFIIKE